MGSFGAITRKWLGMASPPRKEGGLGLRDYNERGYDRKGSKRLVGESIWSVWIRKRYIQHRSLQEITKR